jgi:hypothetical protein
MSPVYIGFSRPKKFMPGAWLIQKWMGTQYSHVYLRLYSAYTEQWLVYQASHGMVHLIEWESFKEKAIIVTEFERLIPPADLKNTIKFAQKLLGSPYGYIGLARIALSKWFKPLLGDGEKSFHCSELIATIFPDLAEGKCKDYIEPVDLYVRLENE